MSHDRTPYGTALEALRAARAVVPHTDADGLAAGALALRFRGESAEPAVLLGRGKTPFGAAKLPAGELAVLDWGMRQGGPPGLIVDHHAPEAEPRDDQVLVSGFGERPEVSTSVLVARIVPEPPMWLAAMGAFGDLGTAAFSLPGLEQAPAGPIRRLTPLINAPRRLPDGPVREALALLVDHPDAASALRDPRIQILREAKEEWTAAYKQALRTPPQMRGDLALIRFTSPYQIHPLVAQAWKRRLAPRVVLVANDEYLPGKVNFVVRGGTGDLRKLLRHALPDVQGEYAHGHPAATGGSLGPETFERLLDALAGSELVP
ncbi:MAG TPA: DHH family phosphoesterase [Actinomycetota bacterium]|nr:DHH family phosphoesterase [Actinomycetota bacterium]